jgi:hypothetical protein
MNERRIGLLAGLLLVQLVVFAGLLFARGGFTEPETGPLLGFDAAAVDGIVIEESQDTRLTLSKQDGRWRATVGDAGSDVPVDAEKVDKLLAKLAELRSPWPVATTSAARERFEVGDDNRQRHLMLQVGGKTAAELLLGTSPGFRRLHVRIPGADEIYEVDLTHFELSTAVDEWLDRAVLAAEGAVSAVAREGQWRLARSDEGWMLDDGGADSNAAEQMTARFANLRVLGVADAATSDASAEPAARFAVTDEQGEYRLSLAGPVEGGEYVVASDRVPGRFRLAAYVAEQLLAEGATLLPGATAPADAAAAGSAVPAASTDATESAGLERADAHHSH